MSGTRKNGLNFMGGRGWRKNHVDLNMGAASSDTARFLRQHKAVEKRLVREGKKAEREPTPVVIRPMNIDDAAYVLDSWANSYRRSPVTGPIEKEVFNIEQRSRINRLVSRPTARIFIAADVEDQRQIRGWVCFERPLTEDAIPILHYVCVHPAYQMQGIATSLVELCRQTARDAAQPMWTTHETQPMRHIREKWNLLYNPYLLEVPDRKAIPAP